MKCLTVADDFSHEAGQIAVDFSMPGQYVPRMLDQIAQFRGYSSAVRTDNRTEFTSRVFMSWARTHGIQHILIQPGRPMQNRYIESFNARFRDECLNEHWFTSLRHAQVVIEAWREEYNNERPKKALGGLTPAAYAKSLAEKSGKLSSDSKALCY